MPVALPFHVRSLTVAFTVASTVRTLKFALSVAELSVPTWPAASVGLVEPITSYVAVPVCGSATHEVPVARAAVGAIRDAVAEDRAADAETDEAALEASREVGIAARARAAASDDEVVRGRAEERVERERSRIVRGRAELPRA